MKKIIILLAVLLLGTLLVSCSMSDILGGTQTPPADEIEKDPVPIVRGDLVIIFAKKSAFDIVYPEGDTDAAAVADSISSAATALGLMKPSVSSDSEKKSTQCELLIGETSRELSAEAKAALADAIAADPRGDHWIWMYKDGRAALYANGADAYALAIAELEENYYIAGEISMKKDTKDIGCVAGPHDAFMEYTVYDNFYEGYTDPFGMKEKDYKEMSVTLLSEDKLVIEYHPSNTEIYRVNFVRKAWGMWMLGEINYTDKKGNHMICPGSTDYEFVFNIGAKTPLSTRSGNHGDYPGDKNWKYHEDDTSYHNDRLLDMTFYDAKSGEKITLDKVGAKVTVNGLRIVMHHNVYELNYVRENVLMNIENSYLFNGFDILLDARLYMTQDVNFKNSYSCMLPIMKSYSNCMMLYNADGTTTYAKTSPVALGGREYDYMLWNFNSPRVEVWGEDNPQYHMTVEIMNPEDQFMGAADDMSYVGLRDMLGGEQNKIYFTFGTSRPTLTHGTELHFANRWTFSYQEDFRNIDREPDFLVIKK